MESMFSDNASWRKEPVMDFAGTCEETEGEKKSVLEALVLEVAPSLTFVSGR